MTTIELTDDMLTAAIRAYNDSYDPQYAHLVFKGLESRKFAMSKALTVAFEFADRSTAAPTPPVTGSAEIEQKPQDGRRESNQIFTLSEDLNKTIRSVLDLQRQVLALTAIVERHHELLTPQMMQPAPPQPAADDALTDQAEWEVVAESAWVKFPMLHDDNTKEDYVWTKMVNFHVAEPGRYEPTQWDCLMDTEREYMADFTRAAVAKAIELGLVPRGIDPDDHELLDAVSEAMNYHPDYIHKHRDARKFLVSVLAHLNGDAA